MPITMAPPAIIFINTDLTESIIETFTRQLFLTQVMDGATFDAYVAADGYYPLLVHQSGWRIMVLRPLYDFTNRELADMVLFAKAGLVSVEINKFGPPGITLPIEKVYLTALIELGKVPNFFRFPLPYGRPGNYFPFGPPGPPPFRPDLADVMARELGQEGIVNDRNFDPYVWWTDPPYKGTKSF